MPEFIITSPDGVKYKVNAPQGATEADAIDYLIETLEQPQVDNYNPTDGMSGYDKFAAGMGKAIVDTGRGIKQLGANVGNFVGLVDDETVDSIQAEVDEARRLDRHLMDTGAGLAGNITGHVAQFLTPGIALKGLSTAGKGAAALSKAGSAIANPNTYKAAALTGAGYAGLQPVATDDIGGDFGRLVNMGMGGVGGAGGLLLGRGLAGGVGLLKGAFQPLTKKGQEAMTGRYLNAVAESPDDAIRNLRSSQPIVPGSNPTAAMAARDAGIAQVERQFPQEMAERYAQNDAARRASIEAMIPDREAAVALRTQTTKPLLQAIDKSKEAIDTGRIVGLANKMLNSSRGKIPELKQLANELIDPNTDMLVKHYPVEAKAADAWKVFNDFIKSPLKGSGRREANVSALEQARLIMDRLKKGVIDQREAGLALGKIKTTNAKYNQALKEATKTIKDFRNIQHETNPANLYAIRKVLATRLNAINPNTGNALKDTAARETKVLIQSIDNQIRKKVPEYGAYLKSYAQLSKPINKSDVTEALLSKVENDLTGAIRPGSFATALKNVNQIIKKATGFKRGKLENIYSPEEIATLGNIKTDLKNLVQAQNYGKAVGSPTAQNTVSQNMLRQFFGPLGAPKSWSEGVLMNSLSKPIDLVYSGAQRPLNNVLAEALQNPAYMAQLMEKTGLPKSAIINMVNNSMVAGSVGAPAGLLGAAGNY